MHGNTKYVHLIRAMRKDDVLYLTEHVPRLDKSLAASVYREGGKIETACFVATNLDPSKAHRIVRVTMIKPMKD